MILNLAKHPEVLRVIRAGAPSYRKHKVIVTVTENVTLSGTYWNGGSRTSYFAVNLKTMQCGGAPQYNPPQFGGPQEDPRVPLPEGGAIVGVGIFCGKTATATLYLNPANVAKLLPGTPTLKQVMEA